MEENKVKIQNCLCGKIRTSDPLDDELFADCQKCLKCQTEIHDVPTLNAHLHHHRINLTPPPNRMNEYRGATSLLSGEEIHNLNQDTKMIVAQMSIDELIQYITECKRTEQAMRSKELIAQVELNKKMHYKEIEKIEKCRQLGVNNLTEAKAKVLNVIEKSIKSYRKMGLNDDKIVKIIVATTDKDESEIRKYL